MNHIEKLQDKLSALEDQSPHNRLPSEMQLLQIAAILALAQEVRHISNQMAWGAPDDIPDRVPPEAGEMAREIGEQLHDCTQTPEKFGSGAYCIDCPDNMTCVHMN